MRDFTKNASLYQHSLKEIVELLSKFLRHRNWIFYTQSFYGIRICNLVYLTKVSVYVCQLNCTQHKITSKQCRTAKFSDHCQNITLLTEPKLFGTSDGLQYGRKICLYTCFSTVDSINKLLHCVIPSAGQLQNIVDSTRKLT